jgi:hypothetical protein
MDACSPLDAYAAGPPLDAVVVDAGATGAADAGAVDAAEARRPLNDRMATRSLVGGRGGGDAGYGGAP